MAATWGSVRRVTRSACVKDSVSGSRARGSAPSAPSAASCMSARRRNGRAESPRLPADEVRRLTPQHALAAAQVRLEFVERGLHFPPLVIQRRELAAGARAGSRSFVTSRYDASLVGTPGSVYSITRTGIGVRSTLLAEEFQRNSLR